MMEWGLLQWFNLKEKKKEHEQEGNINGKENIKKDVTQYFQQRKC